MKKLLLLLSITIILACEETDGGDECPQNASCLPTEQMMQANLDSLREEIMELVTSSKCNDTTDCMFSGFGSKPCGGSWEYLIYSSSIDTTQLNVMVEEYNQLEEELNTVYERGSDCSIAPAPDSVVCEGTGCVAYRDEQAYTEGVCCN